MIHSAFLRKNSSSALFLAGLTIAGVSAIWLDYVSAGFVVAGKTEIAQTHDLGLAPIGASTVSANDLEAAQIAWRFIVNNTQETTGWVNSVDGFQSTTMWDQGSYILALVSAKKLKIIDADEFNSRVELLLQNFTQIVLFDDALPNKVYDTVTLEMADYTNEKSEKGIGWSALDIGRLLSAFRILEKNFPEFGPDIRTILTGWELSKITRDGRLQGASVDDEEMILNQEGRIGYEQYASRAAALWGLDVIGSLTAQQTLAWATIEGVEIPTDNRSHRVFQAITPTLSEPYMLQGLELGLDSEAVRFAERIYTAQENRYKNTGQITFVSEDHVDQEPYFLYSSVHANDQDWAVLTETGVQFPDLRTTSVKAIFAWDALYGTEYTQLGRNSITDIANIKKGWPAGIYEQTGQVNDVYTLNTNAIVLQSIHYKAFGPLWNVTG